MVSYFPFFAWTYKDQRVILDLTVGPRILTAVAGRSDRCPVRLNQSAARAWRLSGTFG